MDQKNNFSNQEGFNDEIDIRDLLLVLWDGKIIISIITGIAALISVFYALIQPNFYVSATLLAPATQAQTGINGLLGQYSGLANAAGISIPSGNNADQTQFAIHLMKSRAFINDFVERHNLLPDLMAIDKWEEGEGIIIYNNNIYDEETGNWFLDGKASNNAKPEPLDIYDEFIGLLEINQSIDTGYVTVSIKHQSPVLASKWVNLLIEDINNAVRKRRVDEASRSIEYLQMQITETRLSELQSVFFQLIQKQTETMMLAEVRREYVFTTIDPAIVPKNKSEPNRKLIVIFGSMIAVVISSFYVLFLAYVRRS